MTFLQEIGKALIRHAPDKIALLSAGPPGEGFFLIVAAEASGLDLDVVGGEVAVILAGRGGGRAPFYQGKASTLDRLGDAVAALEAACRSQF